MQRSEFTALLLCGLLAQPVFAQPTLPDALVRRAFESGEMGSCQVESVTAPQVLFDISGFLPQTVTVQNGAAKYRFDTALLKAGDYDVRAQPLREGKPVGPAATFRISIAPPRNPQRMPVWNWFGGESPKLDWWKARGFTGFRLGRIRDPLTDKAISKNFGRILDDATRMGLDMGAYIYPTASTRWAEEAQTGTRTLKLNGERDKEKPYPLDPAVLEYGRQITQIWTDKYAAYPAWNHALLSSEYYVPFVLNETAIADAKRELNLDLKEIFKPEYCLSAEGELYAVFDPNKLPSQWQSKNGLIEDDNTIYKVLQWWWKRGNGLPQLNKAMAEVIKAKRPDVQTWHDPYRLAPTLGSHAGLDIVSTWTYGYPDMKRLSYATVLQAAARPEKQKVMPNITLFLYKRFVQPIGNSTANLAMDNPGKDPAFTQGPDYAREAMWLNLSQRPDQLAFYYGGVLGPDYPQLDPSVNSPETFDAIGEVSRALIEPYGPTILQSKRQKARVAVLLSAAASWFPTGKPAPYSNETILPFCSLLMMNHVPFEVLLDDDIAAGRLKEFDALCIPCGDTLRRSDYDKILAFAKSGKSVIATNTLRAPIPGAQIANLDFTFQSGLSGVRLAEGTGITADEFREKNEALAAQLKPLVAKFATSASADSPRVLTSTLESGNVRYVFAVNDNKTYGPRFGPWKLVHELGVKQNTTLTIPGETGAVYDALARTVVEPKDGAFETSLPPARGRLFAVLPEKIKGLLILAPKTASRGQKMEITARVAGVSGKAIAGALPLQIEIFDANGDKHPASRYGSTVLNGQFWSLTQSLSLALNDEPGTWTIRVTDLLGGVRSEAKFEVN